MRFLDQSNLYFDYLITYNMGLPKSNGKNKIHYFLFYLYLYDLLLSSLQHSICFVLPNLEVLFLDDYTLVRHVLYIHISHCVSVHVCGVK